MLPAEAAPTLGLQVLAGPGPDSVARANAVHQRALAQHEALIAEFNITLHDKVRRCAVGTTESRLAVAWHILLDVYRPGSCTCCPNIILKTCQDFAVHAWSVSPGFVGDSSMMGARLGLYRGTVRSEPQTQALNVARLMVTTWPSPMPNYGGPPRAAGQMAAGCVGHPWTHRPVR